jgi:hypothetical protein
VNLFANQQPDRLFRGFRSFAIASSAAIISSVLPETAPAIAKLDMAVGTSILSGDVQGALDAVTSGGAC